MCEVQEEVQQTVKCSLCSKIIPPSPEGSVGIGYAFTGSNVTCYECCAELDKQQMRDTGKIILYLNCERWPEVRRLGLVNRGCGGWVNNWPGTLKIPCHTRCGKHNIAGTRYDVWFKFEGYEWWGVCYGENTDIVHCKKTKRKV